jgi:hypothetical protein
METHGSESSSYYANGSAVEEWCHILSSGKTVDARIPCSWVQSMLKETATARWSIQSLVDDIELANFDPEISVNFSGLCCAEDYMAVDKVHSPALHANAVGSNKHLKSSRCESQEYMLVPASELMDTRTSRNIATAFEFDSHPRRKKFLPRMLKSLRTCDGSWICQERVLGVLSCIAMLSLFLTLTLLDGFRNFLIVVTYWSVCCLFLFAVTAFQVVCNCDDSGQDPVARFLWTLGPVSTFLLAFVYLSGLPLSPSGILELDWSS